MAVDRTPVVGLLDHLAATALEEDYAQVAARRPRSGPTAAGRPGRPGRTALVALALFGMLVATAAVQTSRSAGQSVSSRQALVKQVNARKDQLEQRRALVQALQTQVATLQAVNLDATIRGRNAQADVGRVGVVSGRVATRGPGVQIRVDDARHATSAKQQVQAPDLQKLVNGLWVVGAEAISINGQRVTSLTSIRDAAGSPTVNYVSLRRPYVVSAIGNPATMGARLLDTSGGQTWLTLQSTFGLQFHVDTKDSMLLPGARRLTLRSAHVMPSSR